MNDIDPVATIGRDPVASIGRDPVALEAFYREHVEAVQRFVARRVDVAEDAAAVPHALTIQLDPTEVTS